MALVSLQRSLVCLGNLTKTFHRLSVTETGLRGFASKELPVDWEYKPNEPCYKPHISGDLASFPKIDLDQPIPLLQKFPELLENKDDRVKKLLSLRFGRSDQTKKVYELDLIRKVQRHYLDFNSTESRIAQMTANIRNLQAKMETYPYNRRMKVKVKELIDKRRRYLKWLRLTDYRRFEYVIEALEIEYKKYPPDGVKLTRKQSLKRQMEDLTEDIKEKKLQAFREELQKQKEEFEKEKKELEAWIKKEEQELGIVAEAEHK